ncbi:hypothetical protein Patl1_01285 [Pistacia atlantica]|uniref:Uncharacterized protein n=1 Tax=Pistacia atlantica TaxID=434234 RepID=A0ACC1CBE2_9ROSI|nr:hypothetical protein Patl1_01285 [Pistacia atlantica]
MGCVLGKGDRRNTCDRRRSSENACSAVAVTVSEDVNHVVRVKKEEKTINRNDIRRHNGDFPPPERRRIGTETQQGWPSWLMAFAGDAIRDWTPRRASTFEKLDKIGQGTYSNVYKARDLVTGKIVALKKVRFDNLEPESVKFMAREILVLRRLDHPNVIKLEGLVTSRMSCSLYLVFEYMEHDLAGLAACQTVKFTEPQVCCFAFGCVAYFVIVSIIGFSAHMDGTNEEMQGKKRGTGNPLTSRVVTLWYRPPELLLGATYYGVGVDLWSAGCILAELLAGKPIMPGRTEVEQLHKIFKLCGSPSEEYWKKSKLPNATLFKPQQPYKRCIAETFKDFPSSSLPLIETLLSIDPDERGTATAALDSEFFTTEPHACEPSSLPKYPPSKEMDVKLRDQEARRQRGLSGKASAVDGARRVRVRDRVGRAIPAPEANAEIQANLDRWRVVTQGNAKSKSEKFPPPHQDGAVGHPHPQNASGKAPDIFITSSTFNPKSSSAACAKSTGAFGGPSRKRKPNKEDPQMAPSRNFIRGFKPSSIGLSLDMIFKGKSKSEVFGNGKIENNGIS